jgi:hypothetical protein
VSMKSPGSSSRAVADTDRAAQGRAIMRRPASTPAVAPLQPGFQRPTLRRRRTTRRRQSCGVSIDAARAARSPLSRSGLLSLLAAPPTIFDSHARQSAGLVAGGNGRRRRRASFDAAVWSSFALPTIDWKRPRPT